MCRHFIFVYLVYYIVRRTDGDKKKPGEDGYDPYDFSSEEDEELMDSKWFS